jgi:hypothetical protein
MPESTIKEVRMPELHLPEIQRDEIVRTLSEIRLPEIDVPSLQTIASARPNIDVGKAVADAISAVRPSARRPRWPIALGILAILAVVAMAVLRSPAVRERADRAAKLARERMDAMRADDVAMTADPFEADEIEAIDIVDRFETKLPNEVPTPA